MISNQKIQYLILLLFLKIIITQYEINKYYLIGELDFNNPNSISF